VTKPPEHLKPNMVNTKNAETRDSLTGAVERMERERQAWDTVKRGLSERQAIAAGFADQPPPSMTAWVNHELLDEEARAFINDGNLNDDADAIQLEDVIHRLLFACAKADELVDLISLDQHTSTTNVNSIMETLVASSQPDAHAQEHVRDTLRALSRTQL
jgi:hypothetical protein